MTQRVVVMKNPSVCDVWTHPENSFSQSFEYLSVEMLIYCLLKRYEFFMDDSAAVEEGNDHGLDGVGLGWVLGWVWVGLLVWVTGLGYYHTPSIFWNTFP